MKFSSRIVLLGDSTVGKTTISVRLARNQFIEKPDATIGAVFMTYRHNDVKYEIWDTAGQERYAVISPMYYRDADVAVLVFDVSNMKSFDRVVKYVDEVKAKGNRFTKFIIIGNKLDLIDDFNINLISSVIKEKLNSNSNNSLDEEIKVVYFSAKTGVNLQELLDSIEELVETVNLNKQEKIKNHDMITVKPETDIVNDSCTGACKTT